MYATPRGPIRSRRRASTASGSCTCSIVWRNTTQSTSPLQVSIMSRSKRTFAPVYFRRACSNASGLASTPTTDAAVRPSTAVP